MTNHQPATITAEISARQQEASYHAEERISQWQNGDMIHVARTAGEIAELIRQSEETSQPAWDQRVFEIERRQQRQRDSIRNAFQEIQAEQVI